MHKDGIGAPVVFFRALFTSPIGRGGRRIGCGDTMRAILLPVRVENLPHHGRTLAFRLLAKVI